MTDKIMIDGVDVLECPSFSNWHVIMTGSGIVVKEIENCCTPRQKSCKEINCIFKKQYKQLARKTEEYDKLKKDLDSAEFIVRPTTDDYIKQIAEAVGMTDIRLSGGKEFYTWLKDNIIQRIKAERQKVEELIQSTVTLAEGLNIRQIKLEQYKQALEGIKPILEFYANSRMGVETKPGVFALKTEQGIILNYDSQPAREALQVYEEALKTDD